MQPLTYLFSDMTDAFHPLLAPSFTNIWIGKNGAFSMPMLNLALATNFRAASTFHGQYDNVWIIETPLSNIKAWELVLDEAIRLLKRKGKLIVKYEAGANSGFSNYAFKQRLFRNPLLTVSITEEKRLEDGFSVTVFDIERLNFEQYQNPLWSFSIITRGDKVVNVVKFCESIRQQDAEFKHQILILGKPNEAYDPFQVTYLDDSQFRDELAEIAAKKNYIAQHALHENLLISHDRYTLSPDFLSGFDQWGYDYNVATVQQFYQTGDIFPAYCYLQGEQLRWAQPVGCKNYNHLQPLHYLNGGLFVIKRQTLLQVPMNSLLCWNQAEDVEFSYQLRQLGLPPRINVFASAVTLDITPDYTGTFLWDVDLDVAKKTKMPQWVLKFAVTLAWALEKGEKELTRFLYRAGVKTKRSGR